MSHNAHVIMMLPLEDRLMSRTVKRDDGCWEWQGAVTMHGYGRMSWKNHVERTHRLAAHLWLDMPLDSTIVVRHRCDNPPCINPAHLELGTQIDNIRDMNERGRQVSGQKPWDTCSKGHPLVGDNRKPAHGGKVRCRICAQEAFRRYRERRTEREGGQRIYPKAACSVCGLEVSKVHMNRHLKRKHPETHRVLHPEKDA